MAANNKTVQRRVVVSQRQVRTEASDLPEVPVWVKETAWHLPLIMVALVACLLQIILLTHDTYIEPYMKSLQWTLERSEHAHTYDYFTCQAEDITAHEPSQLMIDPKAPVAQAVDSMMHHGMGIFPNVLEPAVADHLRQYVLWKNQRIDVMENIPVIQTQNRYSLGLDVTDHETVRTALTQLVSNVLLTDTLTELLGDNPAIVEFSTITSTVGAKAQHFHPDSTFTGSAAVFGRSFSEVYTILIPLQDTLLLQGATWVCPGTHRCQNAAVCNQAGFQVTTSFYHRHDDCGDVGNETRTCHANSTDDVEEEEVDSSYFKAGDALVYSSSATHRGGSHLMGPDRAVLIVTVASRPTAVRMLPVGPVYGIRWDHWGFCWRDFLDLDQYWKDPFWNKMRALGIYKVSGDDWGWTYLETSAFRMMNDMSYFSFADLQAFRQARVTWFGSLPEFLQGRVEEAVDYAPWPRYLVDVTENLRLASLVVTSLLLVTYVGFATNDGGTSLRREASVVGCILGVIACWGLCIWWGIESSQWAQSVVAGDYRHGMDSALAMSPNVTNTYEYIHSLAAPEYHDILISDRLESPELWAQSHRLDYHPGTRRWKKAIGDASTWWMGYRNGLLPIFEQAVIQRIVERATENGKHQFLKNNIYGDWVSMSLQEVLHETERQLVGIWSLPRRIGVHYVDSKIGGPCARRQACRLCRVLAAEHILLGGKERPSTVLSSVSKRLAQTFRLRGAGQWKLPSTYQSVSSRSGDTTLHQYQVGDRVEARLGDNRKRWYPGTVDQVLDTAILVVFLDSGALEQIEPGSFEFIRCKEEGVLVSSTKVVNGFEGRARRRSNNLAPRLIPNLRK
jgi:ectoine hydroxylase-related dioxygenase (phytanoyl-CoA dioxygenase family)